MSADSRRSLFPGQVWVLGTAAGILAALPSALRAYAAEPRDFAFKLALHLFPYSVWALLVPLVLVLFGRAPLAGPRARYHLTLLLGAGVPLSLGHVLLTALPTGWLLRWHGLEGWSAGLRQLLVDRGAASFIEYLALLAIHHLVASARRLRERELAEARLATRLAESRLQTLRMQLDPHFVFNGLNAVTGLMRMGRGDEAVHALVELGQLLRMSLEGREELEVTLEHEVEFVRRYLGIERLRFGERLQVEMDVEPEAMNALVPALVLQPLVENALRHGVARGAAGGCIRVRATREEDRLLLEVRDNGPGLGRGGEPGTGIGLANTRARLRQLYGEESSLTLTDMEGGGVCARVVLPYEPDSGGAREVPHA
ncbi:sensor histidine kinase [Archangium sp. Cb G35]|uniref:sensor histidine kinase n=1 Tax=Archangium sp. Cb G35 TaxID=1920190 RepID=UPI0013018C50|nr:sensor histidine kinase [Archangium sp. Cb G35]